MITVRVGPVWAERLGIEGLTAGMFPPDGLEARRTARWFNTVVFGVPIQAEAGAGDTTGPKIVIEGGYHGKKEAGD